jgi:hypothetical protein
VADQGLGTASSNSGTLHDFYSCVSAGLKVNEVIATLIGLIPLGFADVTGKCWSCVALSSPDALLTGLTGNQNAFLPAFRFSNSTN